MSHASGDEFVTKEELKIAFEDFHRLRWRAMAAWALVFSIVVTVVLYETKREADIRRQDRSDQIATIVKAGHEECLRAFGSMTAILHTTISQQRIDRATVTERKVIAKLFSLADPNVNCPPQGGLTVKEKQQLKDAKNGATPSEGN